jgi:Flp pilus assembly protein TadB
MSYALKLGAAAIAILLAGVVAILIFDRIWFQVGFGAAIVVLCGVLLIFAWLTDRKAKESRAGIDELPRV